MTSFVFLGGIMIFVCYVLATILYITLSPERSLSADLDFLVNLLFANVLVFIVIVMLSIVGDVITNYIHKLDVKRKSKIRMRILTKGG